MKRFLTTKKGNINVLALCVMIIFVGAATANAYDYQAEFLQTANWLTTQQAGSGGIWEGEDYTYVVETDNTAEAIWIWSRYAELTGDYTTYLSNLNDAWAYCEANPSWLESSATGYYTVYNIGWGLMAETKYRQVYQGRAEYVNHSSYGQSCADHIVNNPPGTGTTRSALCLGIASGALYQYGVDVDSATYRNSAVTLGNSVRMWLNGSTSRFASESWAVSGGMAVWGVLNSYYQEYSGGDTWAATANTYMPLDATGGGNDNYEYGHDGWYAWGHYAVSEYLGSSSFTKYQNIIDLLLDTDGDDDGGIRQGLGFDNDQDYAWPTSIMQFGLNFGLIGNTISGYVLDPNAVAIEGVSVDANNGGTLDTTDLNGYYEVSVSNGWSGTVTPTKAEYVFAPDSRTYSNVTADQANQNYTGTYTPDLTPPEPNIMTWASVPTATGPDSITMTATTATDDSTPVEYYFECTTDGDANSIWQTDETYVATGLDPLTSYTFRVKARDNSSNQNETGWSSEESDTTDAPSTDVEIIGSWVDGLTHTAEAGSDRALIFIAHVEDNDTDMDATSVTYGGQTMTQIIEWNEDGGTSYRAFVGAYYLDEAGIDAATSSDFVVTWNQTPSRTPAYSSVFLENVDQTTAIGASEGNGNTSSPIETAPLSTDDGDMAIVAGTNGGTGNYTVENGFSLGIEVAPESADGVSGYISSTGGTETPRLSHDAVNRQSIIGFVVRAAGVQTVLVPDVVDMTQADANTAIITAGLVVGNITTACSGTIADGNVISQDPNAGTTVLPGSSVDLVVSSGQPSVPDVTGQAEADAISAINAVDYISYGSSTTECSDTVPAGDVISQSATGTVACGTVVDLVVSTGQPTVPDVTGQAEADAISAINAVDYISYGSSTTACSDTVPAGDVISQSATGTVPCGTVVDLVVSSGQPTVPDVTGQAEADAISAINAVDYISYGSSTTECSDTVPAGDVISQSATGTVPCGTVVDLVVSTGPCPRIIFGYITEPDANVPVEGIFVEAIGGDSDTTDANGYYELTVDYGWSGTVEPSKTGYTFEPNSVEYDNVTADQSDSYIATLDTFIIYGYAVDSEVLTPFEGVLISPDSNGGPFTEKYYGGGSDITDADGYYEVLVDHNFSGKVVPSKYAYAFEPNSITYAGVTWDIEETQDYVGTLLTYTITGYIENVCYVPIVGVSVDANNGGGSDVTDVNGFYEVWVDYGWSGVVIPTKKNYTFDPNSMTYVDVFDDVTGQDYIANNIYDLDCDGSIGLGDVEIMCDYWLAVGIDLPGDFYKDEDDTVNFHDFADFAGVWGD